MAVKRWQSDRAQFFDSNGDPLNGGKLFFYVAGSSTKQDTFNSSAGSVANANPLVLDSAGRPSSEIWMTTGVSYKVILANSTDSDPPASPIWSEDNVQGINDATSVLDEWITGPDPTYVSSTSFTVVGDQTSVLTVGRRVKIVDSGGTKYGTIKTSAYTSLTTITLDSQDSDALATPLSTLAYGIFAPTNTSHPVFPDSLTVIGGSADRSKRLRDEVDGISTGTTRVRTAVDYDVRVGNLPAGIGPVPYAGATVPTGWLECDGSAVSRTTYAALFTAISTTWGAGDGSTTFNLPDMRGKMAIGSGTGTVVESGVDAGVDTTNDTLTVASNSTKWITGMSVVFTLSSGTITGLTSSTTYYVIRASSTTVKLASSLANAQNGTAIDMTAKSSPVWTITHTYTARTLGQYGGEEAHAMSSAELLSHAPAVTLVRGTGTGGALDGVTITTTATAQTNFNNLATSATAGGNAAMNIMNPFAVVKYIISY